MSATVIYKKQRSLAALSPPEWRLPASWEEGACLVHPMTGNDVFAQVSELKLGRDVIAPAGPIFLRCGLHKGANKGFGFQHIWAEHFRHVLDRDIAALEIATFFAGLLKPKQEVLYSPDDQQNLRVTAKVVRLHLGTAVIDYRPDEACYSIVTGGRFGRNTKGSVVGALV